MLCRACGSGTHRPGHAHHLVRCRGLRRRGPGRGRGRRAGVGTVPDPRSCLGLARGFLGHRLLRSRRGGGCDRGRGRRRAGRAGARGAAGGRRGTGAGGGAGRAADRSRHGRNPDAVAAVGNKLRCARSAQGGRAQLAVPRFIAAGIDKPPAEVAARVAAGVGWPCVLKPLLLSASRGVMRADDAPSSSSGSRGCARCSRAGRCWSAIRSRRGRCSSRSSSPGPRSRSRGCSRGGALHALALFDKPDPLDGPFFEETIYVTPSRLPPRRSGDRGGVAAAARAIGLREGPVHAELRRRASAGQW